LNLSWEFLNVKTFASDTALHGRKEKPLSRTNQLTAMPRIASLDEAVIDAQPMAFYKAVLNEFGGVTHWWMPIHE
jgi:hypothetical protein